MDDPPKTLIKRAEAHARLQQIADQVARRYFNSTRGARERLGMGRATLSSMLDRTRELAQTKIQSIDYRGGIKSEIDHGIRSDVTQPALIESNVRALRPRMKALENAVDNVTRLIALIETFEHDRRGPDDSIKPLIEAGTLPGDLDAYIDELVRSIPEVPTDPWEVLMVPTLPNS